MHQISLSADLNPIVPLRLPCKGGAKNARLALIKAVIYAYYYQWVPDDGVACGFLILDRNNTPFTKYKLMMILDSDYKTICQYTSNLALPPYLEIDGAATRFFPMDGKVFAALLDYWKTLNYRFSQMAQALQLVSYLAYNCRRCKDGFSHSRRAMAEELGRRSNAALSKYRNDLAPFNRFHRTLKGFNHISLGGTTNVASRYTLNRRAIATAGDRRFIIRKDTWGFNEPIGRKPTEQDDPTTDDFSNPCNQMDDAGNLGGFSTIDE